MRNPRFLIWDDKKKAGLRATANTEMIQVKWRGNAIYLNAGKLGQGGRRRGRLRETSLAGVAEREQQPPPPLLEVEARVWRRQAQGTDGDLAARVSRSAGPRNSLFGPHPQLNRSMGPVCSTWTKKNPSLLLFTTIYTTITFWNFYYHEIFCHKINLTTVGPDFYYYYFWAGKFIHHYRGDLQPHLTRTKIKYSLHFKMYDVIDF